MRKSINKTSAFIFILMCITDVFAQYAQPGQDGVWILMNLNDGSRSGYTIWKKSVGEEWKQAGKLLPPKSEAEVEARLFDIDALNLAMPPRPGNSQIKRIWRLVQKNAAGDSFAPYYSHYPALYAAGFAWYDADVKKDVSYSYKVVRNDASGREMDTKILDPVKVPGEGPLVNFVLKSMKNTSGGNTLDFEIDNIRDMVHVHIFRSYYQRTGYEKINPDMFFTKTKEGFRFTFTDGTAADRVPYSYYIVPFDAAGNPGPKSIDLKMYSTPENRIPPSVTGFKSNSENEKKAVRLRWKLSDPSQVVSVDVYKSMVYDGKYFKIASLKPHDTQYFDYEVKPVSTYYYTVVLNGMYESSPTSPRISGMLEGVNGNYLSPQQVDVMSDGKYAKLTWTRTETDTRGYFLWRGIGSVSDLKKVREILSDSLHLQFTDTIPVVDVDARIFYAVSDVNTSYNEGPKSEIVSCIAKGEKSLIPPDTIGVYPISNNQIRVIWKAVGLKIGRIQGYNLYRYIQDANGFETEGSLIKLNTSVIGYANNYLIDSTMKTGVRYAYFVRSVGENENELSKKSPEVVFVSKESEKPANVSQMQGFAQEGGARIIWNNPMGDKLTGVEIWRNEAGKEMKLLKKLDSKTQEFNDSGLKLGTTYYYFLQCVYGENKSGFSDEIGLTAR